MLCFIINDVTKETEEGEAGETGQLRVSALPLTQCGTVALLEGGG